MEKEADSKPSELENTASGGKDEETGKDAKTKEFDEDPLGRKEFVTRDR
jgi:hypothetical protein